MRRLLRTILVATAVCAPVRAAQAAAHRTSFVLPVGAKVQVAALSDGYTVGLSVRGLDARQLERALLRLRAEDVSVLGARGAQSLAYVRFGERVVAAEARLGKPQHHSVRVHLQITEESPRNAMLAHVMDAALPVPRTLETDALAKADDAFVHKRLAEAELMLKRLQDSGLQRAWVMVRLGDLAVFRDRLEEACALYAEAQADGGMRTASTLAALRGRVLGCHEAKHHRRRRAGDEPSANPAHVVDWALLLRRDGRDDPIGRRMAQEARWALGYERDPAVLHEVLQLEGEPFRRNLDGELRAALWARLLRRSEPFALAVAQRRGAWPTEHPEAFDLALSFGQAWCALDAPSGWVPPKANARSWMQLSRLERTRLVQQVSACTLLGTHEPTPKAAHAELKPAVHLARLRERLERLQRALNAGAKDGYAAQ